MKVVRVGLVCSALLMTAGCADGGTVAPYSCEENATMPCRKGETASPNNQYVCVGGEWINMCANDTPPAGGSGG